MSKCNPRSQLSYAFEKRGIVAMRSSTVVTARVRDLIQPQGPAIMSDKINSTANITMHSGLVAIMHNKPMPKT